MADKSLARHMAGAAAQWHHGLAGLLPGVVLAGLLAAAAGLLAAYQGGPAMLYALVFGLLVGALRSHESLEPGLAYASKALLRIGVALLGAGVTLADLAVLGSATAGLVLACVGGTIVLGWLVGRALRMRSDHAVLSAGAVAICGASAALAISAALPPRQGAERDTVVTVIGVTTLSTLAMVAYPPAARLFGLDELQAAIFIGASIHDVAQVVGAGYMISDEAAATAILVKLMRVACLLPAVICITAIFRARSASADAASRPPLLPLFLVGFLAMLAANSMGLIADRVGQGLMEISRWCLLMAVAALGAQTSPKDLVAVGPLPLAVMLLQTVLIAAIALAGLAWIAAAA